MSAKYVLAHAGVDSEFALKLARDLRTAGLEIWLDRLDQRTNKGKRPWRVIGQELRSSTGMIPVVTPESLVSDNELLEEISMALGEKKRVVPALLCLPDVLPDQLLSLGHVDFTSDYAAGLAHLLRAVGIGSRLDPENPWPGLDSFGEADRAFFHGRDSEASELLRLVQGEALTVLFGRSGLGKTSLLQAGLFPHLRDEDLLPVYIRLDYASATPLREQVLTPLAAECAAHKVEAPSARPDETLWEFFHRVEAEFWNARSRPVTPVLVFDQFEEMFAVGEADAAAQQRAAAFAAELGEVVENRVPPSLKEALELEETRAGQYDFRARRVKIVLSFREDFLAQMEGLRRGIPSLMHNRFRLRPLTGGQAFEAVTRSGAQLLDDDVALRIIGLAGRGKPEPPPDRAELAQLEIDPALLSVLCSELNAKRRRAGQPTITRDLLAGAESEILRDFYERGFAGLDPRVRVFIEDRLLTASGFRNSYARDDALAEPGVTEQALQTLVTRRLVREDERFGARRVELTHDILIPVLQASREARQAREVEAAALAGEREKQKGRRARIFLIAFPAAIVSVVVAAGVALWLVFTSFTEMTQAVEQRRSTVATTSELSQLVERMSRLISAFAATGDERYIVDYYALTGYRTVIGGSGLREFLTIDRDFPARMRAAGASEEELAVLERALGISDSLHKLQQIAFAAMRGLYDPQKGKFIVGGEPHHAFALKILYGTEYEKLTAALEADAQRLAELADARTNSTVKQETDELFVAIVVVGSGLGMLLVLTVAALVIIGAYRSPGQRAVAESAVRGANRLKTEA